MSSNAALRVRLAELNISIPELQSRLKTLEHARQSIEQQLDGIVYPVLTLPNEITAEIFCVAFHRSFHTRPHRRSCVPSRLRWSSSMFAGHGDP